jgi:hypothetical protein
MVWFGESAADTTKAAFFTLLVPILDPITGADRGGKLTKGLTLVFIRLLGAKDPFIVTIPAVHRLVGRRKALVARGGSDILDHVQTRHFLLVELGRFGGEDLEKFKVTMLVQLRQTSCTTIQVTF